MNTLSIDGVTKVTVETTHDDPYSWTILTVESVDYKEVITKTKITLLHRNRSPTIVFDDSKLDRKEYIGEVIEEVIVEEVVGDPNI